MDTPDYENETYEDALNEIKKVLNGGYGPFIYEASFLIEAEGEIASVILVNLFENEPLITYLFTRKKFLNQGMASSLIERSKHELIKSEYKKINLFVNKDNNSAINNYLKAGFKIINQLSHN
jgi:GNAT superfamily N-acetyltransferase